MLKAGLQATLQGAAREAARHLGVPASGAGDPVSLALANRLVGNGAFETGIEVLMGGLVIEARSAFSAGVAGAPVPLRLNGRDARLHETLQLSPGDRLELGHPPKGAASYIAVAGGIAAARFLGSVSTYLPARLGGHEGRALSDGDRLALKAARQVPYIQTPDELRLVLTGSLALRAVAGSEFESLSEGSRKALFERVFSVSMQVSRMGARLEGTALDLASDGKMQSAPVFPGTLQCPEDGQPILIGCDGQTTGGYPRILQVARCDRHLIGQLRPGDRVRFLRRDPETAARELAAKAALLRGWIGEDVL